MNTVGFLLSSLGKKMGIRRRAAWRIAINREHHLLKTTEQSLGEQAWQEVEKIEELAIEFWEIKDIENQQADLEKRNRKLESEVERFQARRDQITEGISEQLERKKGELIDKNSALDAVTHDLEQLEHDKRVIEKRFETLKLKRKVLLEQGDSAEKAQSIYDTLKELKEEHTQKKQSIVTRTREVGDADRAISTANEEISRLQESIREETSDVTEEFNQLSRRVAQNRSRIGALELTKNRALIRIGRFLGLHHEENTPEIRAVCRNHRHLVSRTVALRRSIKFYQRLAGEN